MPPSVETASSDGAAGAVGRPARDIGALAAGMLMALWRGWGERATIITTLAGSAVALVGYGASGRLVLALAVLLGFMLAANNISVNSAIQLHSEPRYRGRIDSLYNMIFKGGPAVVAAVFGWLAHLTNVRLASVAAAIALGLLTRWIVGQTMATGRRRARFPINREA